MHELTLAHSLKDIIAGKIGAARLRAVNLEIGRLSGVVPETMRFCTQTVMEEAFGPDVAVRLAIREAEAACGCGRVFTLADALQACPECGGFERQITAGTETFVKSIEVEE